MPSALAAFLGRSQAGFIRRGEPAERDTARSRFYDLREIRHGGGLTPDQYYDQAVKHMQTGRRSIFYHNGQFKDAFITRTGPDSFTFTSANKNGRQIFTHMDKDVTSDYLRNRGITLPKGF
jgi:hypothetical protein